jgi:hypothetical protein
MNKHEQKRRDRGTGSRMIEGGGLMRFAGIDVAAERHVAAMVDGIGRELCKPSAFVIGLKLRRSPVSPLTPGAPSRRRDYLSSS